MKTMNDYMEMPYRMEIIEDKEEGGFVAFYPDLPGCITCGQTSEICFFRVFKKEVMDDIMAKGVEA